LTRVALTGEVGTGVDVPVDFALALASQPLSEKITITPIMRQTISGGQIALCVVDSIFFIDYVLNINEGIYKNVVIAYESFHIIR
jgi:hypothetical protein